MYSQNGAMCYLWLDLQPNTMFARNIWGYWEAFVPCYLLVVWSVIGRELFRSREKLAVVWQAKHISGWPWLPPGLREQKSLSEAFSSLWFFIFEFTFSHTLSLTCRCCFNMSNQLNTDSILCITENKLDQTMNHWGKKKSVHFTTGITKIWQYQISKLYLMLRCHVNLNLIYSKMYVYFNIFYFGTKLISWFYN